MLQDSAPDGSIQRSILVQCVCVFVCGLNDYTECMQVNGQVGIDIDIDTICVNIDTNTDIALDIDTNVDVDINIYIY